MDEAAAAAGAGAGSSGGAEFQAVILEGGSASALYPLADSTPVGLLPVANRPLLGYQLELLEKSGFSAAIVVCEEDSVAALRSYLEARRGKIKVDLVSVEEETGTADMLRAVKDRISTDFLVIKGDLVTEGFVHHLADMHRIRDAAMTMLLKALPLGEEDARGRVKRPPLEDLVGLNEDDSRVVMIESAEDLEGSLTIEKGLLKRVPSLAMHTDLSDAHCYIFSHWVMGLLEEKPDLTSVRFDLVPHLVRAQFLGERGVPESLRESARSAVALANSMSASSDIPAPDDLVRCFALVLPADGLYCARARSLAQYARMNRDVMSRPRSEYTPWPKPTDTTPSKFRDSLLGADCTLGSKASVKRCVIGAHVTIGAGAKLNQCIVMDNCVIGDNCVIQNSIICKESNIGERCNINECQLGASTNLEAGTRMKDETVGKGRMGDADGDFF